MLKQFLRLIVESTNSIITEHLVNAFHSQIKQVSLSDLENRKESHYDEAEISNINSISW